MACDSRTLKICNDEVSNQYGELVERDVMGRLLGVILWKRKEHRKF